MSLFELKNFMTWEQKSFKTKCRNYGILSPFLTPRPHKKTDIFKDNRVCGPSQFS